MLVFVSVTHFVHSSVEARTMTNGEKLNNTCAYDLLTGMAQWTSQCVLLLVSDMSLEDKCNRCRRYSYGDCEHCIQDWLNEKVDK